jgi:predicted PurR-regulated permease PerM
VRGLILVVFGTAVISTIDNFIRPAMVSGKTSMNGLVVLLSIMGGVASFGFVGLVLGPVIAAAVILLLQVAASEE